MKRIGFIYEQIVSVENCKMAIINASAKKRRRKSVQDITSNLDYYDTVNIKKLKEVISNESKRKCLAQCA